MASILVICYDTSSGKYLAQLAGSAQIADGAITSGKLASGIVGTVHLRDLNVTSAKLAAAIIGLLGTVADGAIISAKLASGIVGSVHLADGAVKSGDIGANVIATPHIKNQGILSASIGTGIIGDALLKNFGLVSGKYASGSITEQALVSGISIDITEISQEPTYRAEDLISAYLGVQFSISGYFNHAQAADVDTMPAVGVAIANILSGQLGTFQHQGRIGNPNWDFSGHVGELLFLGTSSQVTLTAPATSGECVQRIGKVIDPTTVFLRPELQYVQLAE